MAKSMCAYAGITYNEKEILCVSSHLFFFFSELMITMGFPKDEITEALVGQKYDEVMATYLLLGRKPPEVLIK